MEISKTMNAATLNKNLKSLSSLCCLLLFNTRNKGNSRRNVTLPKYVRRCSLDDRNVAGSNQATIGIFRPIQNCKLQP